MWRSKSTKHSTCLNLNILCYLMQSLCDLVFRKNSTILDERHKILNGLPFDPRDNSTAKGISVCVASLSIQCRFLCALKT